MHGIFSCNFNGDIWCFSGQPSDRWGLSGTVVFVANDVYAKVTGAISGTKENVELSQLNYSATEEPSPLELATWKNLNLTFLNKKSVIKIDVTIENLSDERNLEVKFTGDAGVTENVKKVLKCDGEDYISGDAFELSNSTKTNNITTFSIEMSVSDANVSVLACPFEYIFSLNNVPETTETQEERFKIDLAENESKQMMKSDSQAIPKPKNLYEYQSDGETLAYIDFSVDDITNIPNGTQLTITFYAISMDENLKISINEEEHLLEGEEMGDYNKYIYSQELTGNISFKILSELDMIMIF